MNSLRSLKIQIQYSFSSLTMEKNYMNKVIIMDMEIHLL